ncbi:riboflavin synthase, partial [Vibrio splendidus]
MTSKRCPKGSAKNVLLFVEGDLLRMLGYFPLAAIKTLLSRTKFNRERSTRPRMLNRNLMFTGIVQGMATLVAINKKELF